MAILWPRGRLDKGRVDARSCVWERIQHCGQQRGTAHEDLYIHRLCLLQRRRLGRTRRLHHGRRPGGRGSGLVGRSLGHGRDRAARLSRREDRENSPRHRHPADQLACAFHDRDDRPEPRHRLEGALHSRPRGERPTGSRRLTRGCVRETAVAATRMRRDPAPGSRRRKDGLRGRTLRAAPSWWRGQGAAPEPTAAARLAHLPRHPRSEIAAR